LFGVDLFICFIPLIEPVVDEQSRTIEMADCWFVEMFIFGGGGN